MMNLVGTPAPKTLSRSHRCPRRQLQSLIALGSLALWIACSSEPVDHGADASASGGGGSSTSAGGGSNDGGSNDNGESGGSNGLAGAGAGADTNARGALATGGHGGTTDTGGAAGGGGQPGGGGIANTGGNAGAASGGSAGAASGGSAGAASGGQAAGPSPTEPELLIAFIGDQGDSTNSDAVLQLIADEGAAATVHNGDFDYVNNPAAWEARINSILGADYPYFAIIGNHDAAAWAGPTGYASYIQERQARVPEMECSGELGVKANCVFRGLHLVQSCVGVSELNSTCASDSPEHVSFIRDSLSADDHLWSICGWHKNQRDLQVGTKSDEVGWGPYQECMKAGAMVITGHEHSYARTQSLAQVGNAAAGHGAFGALDVMQLGPGSNFVVVSGLAGVGIRPYDAAIHDDDTWWATYFASDRWLKNGVDMMGAADYGALFIRFSTDGDAKKALGYFKDVTGRIADEFTIVIE